MVPPLPLLSVDPSSTNIGWALLHVGPDSSGGHGPDYLNSGVEFVPEVPQEHRVPHVGQLTQKIISDCRPLAVLIEIPDFNAAWAKGQIVWFYRAVGVVEYVAFLNHLPIHRVGASVEKRKERKQLGVNFFREKAGRYPTRNDESDAFWNGWHYLKSLIPAYKPSDDLDDWDYDDDDFVPENGS